MYQTNLRGGVEGDEALGRERLPVFVLARVAAFPDIPTMAESGFPAVEVLNWQGLVGPKGLSPELIQQLNGIGNKALQDPDLKQKILSQGNEVGGGTPEAFAALIKAEAPRWGKVVKDAKIEPE